MWSTFIKFFLKEDESILEEFSSDNHSQKEKVNTLFNPLFYYAIQKNSKDMLESMFSLNYNPPMKFLFLAMEKSLNIFKLMIEQGVVFNGEIIRGSTRKQTYALVLSKLCGDDYELSSYVYYENPRGWKGKYYNQIIEIVELILTTLRQIDGGYKVPTEALWNAMAAGNYHIVELLQKYGGQTSFMETQALPLYHQKARSATLDGLLALTGSEIISSYAGGHLIQYDAIPKTYSNRLDVEAEGWDTTSQIDTPDNELIINVAPTPLPTVQNSLWDLVLSGEDVQPGTSLVLPWMEPTPSFGEKEMEHLEVKIEEQNKILRALSGLY
jgi:hypothetical protein